MARIEIPKKDLERLYYKEKKSKYKIGEIYGCSFKTVLNRMREYGMKPLSRSVIQSRYEKHDFSGNSEEKAYMIGFRIGDLNVYKTVEHSEVVVARCNTTCIDQASLIEDMFSRYGQVSYKPRKNKAYNINCFLNSSFDFLLKKSDNVDNWIKKDDNCSVAFAAGYVDAEGNLGVYDGRARFKIDSYDKNIIFWMYGWCVKSGIACPEPKMIGKKNQVYDKKRGYKYNNDLWRIRVSKMESLEKLLNLLNPHIKHRKRKKDLIKCLDNLDERKRKN